MINLQSTEEFSLVDSTIYELFSSTLYDGVWYAEKTNPESFIVDKNFNTLLGYSSTKTLKWQALISPQDATSFQYQIANFSSATNNKSQEKIRFIHKNGSVIWMESIIYANTNSERESKFIFIGFKEITQQNIEELTIKRQQKREYEILNGSGIGTWEYNVITGEVNFNESYAKIIGYSLDELNEMKDSFWALLTHPEDVKYTERLITEYIDSKSPFFEIEVRLRHKQGHWVWVMDFGKTLSYTSDNQPEWLGGIHYEITERKNAELLAQKYKELLEDVNKAAEIGIWEVNLKTNELQCSDEIKKIFEIPLSSEPSLNDAIGFIKEGKSRKKVIASIKSAIKKGENYDIEVEVVTANKNTIWCRAIGISQFKDNECTRFYGFFKNIHTKTMASKELALKEELFRKTFSHAAVGMAVIDLKGNISKVNKNLCEYLGYTKRQLSQNNFNKFSHPEDKDLTNDFIDDLLLGKSESFRLDKRYIHKDSTILWGHISVSSVRNEMGRITYFVVQVQDITERKNNELLLINYKDLLERSNYVAKIGSWEINVNDQTLSWSNSLSQILNTRDNHVPTFSESIAHFIFEPHRDKVQYAFKTALEKGINFDIQALVKANESEFKWMRFIGLSEFENNKSKRFYGLIQDIDDIKKAQIEVINKEEQWRTTFNHANAGIALINFNGKAYNVNKGLCDIFGYTIIEMEHLSIKDISICEDLGNNIELMTSLIDGTIDNFSNEMRFLHKNGQVIWVNICVSAVKNDFNKFTHMVAQVVDITASKTNEILLIKYKEILERSNNVAKIGSWELDPETQILFWSENLGRLLGNTEYTPHSLNDSITDYILEENREQMIGFLNDASKKGIDFDFELQLKTATGIRWMRMIGISNFKDGVCKSVHGLIQDIDEFKSVQSEILVREEEFRQTFWHAPIGMALLDLNGKMIRLNPGICETFGYTEKEMMVIDKNQLTHPDDSATTKKLMEQLLSGQCESFQQEKRYFHKNQSLIWAILSMSAVKNDKGQTTHFVCQVNDITDKKLLSETLKEHNNRLQNYAHIVSHNLRSHTGNMSMLLELSEINHKAGFEDELFEHIKSASNNMSETVDHLSEIVEIQNPIKNTLVPINLRKRVKKSIQNVQTTISQINGEVVIKVKRDLMVFGISSYVDSIILNMLTNSIKYRSPHRLLIVNIKAIKINGFTSLSVSDNGLGIDLDKHGSKIFGMYKTFHDHKNARGIGLFITKNQIEAMDGTIAVESQLDVGSTFTIHFKDEDN